MPEEAARGMSREEIEHELKVLIIDALKLDETSPQDIDSEAPLVSAGIGLDSIDVLELAMAVHKRFGVKTGTDDAENHKIYSSVRSLTEHIAAEQSKGLQLGPTES